MLEEDPTPADFQRVRGYRGGLARTDYLAFCRHALRPVKQSPARHHQIMIRHITDLVAGTIDRLMLLLPPGSAKTTYASILLPGWFFAQEKRLTMLAASHTADFAADISLKAQKVITDNESVLDYQFRRARSDLFETTNGGQYVAFGAGGAISGRRADLIAIDDPFGSRKDADSVTKRQEIWDWYRGDLIGRLRPKGRIMLINTHWHEDDLAGRLIDEMKAGGEQWRVVSMQAIYDGTEADPLDRSIGQALWPEWEDVDALLKKQTAAGPREWEALFQQRPRPSGGLLFQVDKLIFVDELPRRTKRRVRYWDIAATEGAGDWTVGLRLSEIEGGWCVEDVRRKQWSPNEVKQEMLSVAESDGPDVKIVIPLDPGAAGKFMAADFVRMLAGYRVEIMQDTGKKEVKANPVATQVEAGNISVFKAHWTQRFKEELAAFPAGAKDDQVDALGGAFNAMIRKATKTYTTRINHMSR